MTLPKNYYLPQYRAMIAGCILMLMGFALTFGLLDFHAPIKTNLQLIFLNFTSVTGFIISVLMLAVKAVLFAGGCYFIKGSDKIVRAKIDFDGFYYREFPQRGNRLQKTIIDRGALNYVPFNKIKAITYKKSLLLGGKLYMTLSSGRVLLNALGVLKEHDKKEIAAEINSRIHTVNLKRA